VETPAAGDETVFSELKVGAGSVAFSRQALIGIAESIVQSIPMDEDRFRAFYERTARPLWAYLLRVSGNRDAADDLAQESFCRFLAAKLPQMDDAESKSYLYRIATNLLRDRWRLQKRASPLEAPAETGKLNFEAQAEVRRAFQELKPRERQLLWLAHVEGYSHQEIAAITGLRSGSIRLLLFRARRRLAGVLRKHAGPSRPETVR
jgi:RNA polymerase sigma-70 factor (ECF subfamily)